MAGKRADWEEISDLGGGGQSKVSLVRNSARQDERANCLKKIQSALDGAKNAELAAAIWSFARPDIPSELGALKLFKIPPKGSGLPPPPRYEPIERLKNEIAALNQGRAGLPKLIDFNEDERWIVTEYFPERTLQHHPFKYKEKVLPALKLFGRWFKQSQRCTRMALSIGTLSQPTFSYGRMTSLCSVISGSSIYQTCRTG